MIRKAFVTLIAGTLLAACNQEGQEDAAPADTSANMPGMEGMQGMEGMPGMDMGGSGAMMQEMESHMKMMEGAQGDSLRNMATMHRQMAANTLAQMNRDMQQMNMPADADWNALTDSLRQDLTRMPEWSAQDMQAMMSAHMARMRRLMAMHAAMMKTM